MKRISIDVGGSHAVSAAAYGARIMVAERILESKGRLLEGSC